MKNHSDYAQGITLLYRNNTTEPFGFIGFLDLLCPRVWDQCNVIQDYLTVYDGSLATDPVLVRLCGGDAVPDIVSSGPNMLLEFHTSAFDNPFHPVPLSYLPGFELDVEVIIVVHICNVYYLSYRYIVNHNKLSLLLRRTTQITQTVFSSCHIYILFVST